MPSIFSLFRASKTSVKAANTPTTALVDGSVKGSPQPPNSLSEIHKLQENICAVFQGKEQVVKLAIVSLLAKGHLLLEDVPGVGKTMLARALSRSLALPFRRLQFTSDLLPSDVLGVSIFDAEKQQFVLHRGPIFHNILLIDEINRASPRTQSALLEAMQEGHVTIDDHTHSLPDPFLVIATQNPFENHGTYPLPESQLDRFLLRLSIGYPDVEIERALLLSRSSKDPIDTLQPSLTPQTLSELQNAVDEVFVEGSLIDYLMSVITATRQSPKIAQGASTRTALSTIRALRAHALLQGRMYCLLDDFDAILVHALSHRIRLPSNHLSSNSRLEAEGVVRSLIASLPRPQ